MATTLDMFERKRRILLVYKYYVETCLSYRKLSDYIKEKENIYISSVTIKTYLEEMKKHLTQDKIDELDDIKNSHLTNPLEINKRVLESAKLCISGYTIDEISEKLDASYWSIYRDLTVRLQKLDKEKFNCVKEILKENSIGNRKK